MTESVKVFVLSDMLRMSEESFSRRKTYLLLKRYANDVFFICQSEAAALRIIVI
jgi:hypothetical protein